MDSKEPVKVYTLTENEDGTFVLYDEVQNVIVRDDVPPSFIYLMSKPSVERENIAYGDNTCK